MTASPDVSKCGTVFSREHDADRNENAATAQAADIRLVIFEYDFPFPVFVDEWMIPEKHVPTNLLSSILCFIAVNDLILAANLGDIKVIESIFVQTLPIIINHTRKYDLQCKQVK